MGIIFRNGIPFGAAAEDDVTTVYTYEDLLNLTMKKQIPLIVMILKLNSSILQVRI